MEPKWLGDIKLETQKINSIEKLKRIGRELNSTFYRILGEVFDQDKTK